MVMRWTAPTRMHVVRKEEKEAKLRQFILKHLEARKGASSQPECWDFIARSVESPVFKVLSGLHDESTAAGVRLRLILLRLDGAHEPACGSSNASLTEGVEARLISDLRILEAHEQLVLGPMTTWIGDCMRREPAKRDAYECYAEDCAETATWAGKAFARLWTLSTPLPQRPAMAASVSAETVEIGASPLPAMCETNSQPTASTRH